MIFELRSATNYHSIALQPDLDRRFCGERIGDGWRSIAANFTEDLQRRKVGDFPAWGFIPVFSERAVGALGDLLRPNGELLPFECSGIPLYAFNVTRIADILDQQTSDFYRYSNGAMGHISRYEFHAATIAGDLTIFKLPPEQSSRVYVTDAFADAVQSAKLRGFRFEQLWPHEPRVLFGAPSPKSLDELMERDTRDELDGDFDSALWLMLCDRISSVESLKQWPEPVRVYYASRLLEWEVGNGGFAQAAMNVPEWFEEAAKGYEVLGKPQCAMLIRNAAAVAKREAKNIERSSASLEEAFAYFREGVFEDFDNQLDAVGWWSDADRVDYVRANRALFSERQKRG